MKSIIDVFRMDEVSPKTRAKIIISLGDVINHQYSSNITEPLVCELVKQLDPDNEILVDKHYLQYK